MCAFVYALNDCDERVRLAACCNIHAELKKNPCCCNCQVSGALMCALGDCDKRVRKCAEKSLCLCGYEVADCPATCNSGCGSNGCGPAAANCAAPANCGPAAANCAAPANCGPAAANCGPAPAACCAPAPKACTAPAPAAPAAAPSAAPAPAPAPSAAAPAPAPPAAEPEAYFPSQLRDQQTRKTRNSLSNLFGLRN